MSNRRQERQESEITKWEAGGRFGKGMVFTTTSKQEYLIHNAGREYIYIDHSKVLLDNQADICIHHCFMVRDTETEGCW
jgi:hypothetical protein